LAALRALLSGFEEVFRPAVVEVGGEAFEDDANFVVSRILLAGDALDIADDRFWSGCGFEC
jgi:hypothetical protein